MKKISSRVRHFYFLAKLNLAQDHSEIEKPSITKKMDVVAVLTFGMMDVVDYH